MDGSFSSSSSSSSSSSCLSSLSLGTSDLEAGFSGSTAPFPLYASSYSYSGSFRRKGSYRSMAGPLYSPRSGPRFFYDPLSDDEPGHFLDSCFLCKKPLGGHRDIYMYRGDTPFCSEECRQEQIEMDEAKEKKWKLSKAAAAAASASPPRKENQSKSPSKSEKYHLRASGTVVAG